MLRCSAAPLAISVFFLTACGSGDEETLITPPPVGTELPPSPGTDSPDFSLEITTPPGGETHTLASSSKTRTLSAFSENLGWTGIVRGSNGQGGFIGLRFTDNGNGDAEHFTYDEATGELVLNKPIDFERPVDANGDNIFELQMIAYEYPNFPPLDFALDVTDQKEIFEDFPVVWLHGETRFGGLGRNIMPLGDLDNDGRPDLAVAAPGRHQRDQYSTLAPSDYHPSGDVYLVSGSVLSETSWLKFSEDSGPGILHLPGSNETLNFGYNMALIDDLDNDQVNDFLVARDDRDIHVVSGAALVDDLKNGSVTSIDALASGVISLEDPRYGHKLDPRTFEPLGDLDGDGLSELAFCANNVRSGSNVEAHVFTLSGTAMQDVLQNRVTRPITDYFATSQAAYYSYLGNHAICGPLTAIGDVDNDTLMDIAIPMPGPRAGDSGVLVFSGIQLLGMLQDGGRITVSAIDRFLNNAKEPFVHFTDNAATGTEQHFMVNALGDVTGDEIDDFSFGWGRYQGADDSAYVVAGASDLLSRLGETSNLRNMIASGGSIQLAASPSNLGANNARVEHIHVLRAGDESLHDTFLFVGAGESTGLTFESYVLPTDRLPDGGTAIVSLPISGAGRLAIPRGNRRLLSYVKTVGDLNTDGYADLAIGWGTYDGSDGADAGAVLLVSGKEVIDTHSRGETFWPHTMVFNPN